MAIKISDTEVISDSRTVLVTGAAGVYDTLNPSYSVSLSNSSGSNMISFDQTSDGINHGRTNWDTAGQLGGNITWSINGTTTAAGRTRIMFIDATSAGYDQTFTFPNGGTILWPEDTEPDFALARYWAHYITCWDASTVSIVSTSWSSM
jgi:hypothetical protein